MCCTVHMLQLHAMPDEPTGPWVVHANDMLHGTYAAGPRDARKINCMLAICSAHAHEMPEADWLLAAAVASAPRMPISQLARLLKAAVALELDVTATAASASWLKPPSKQSGSMQGGGEGGMGGSGEELWVTHLLRESQVSGDVRLNGGG
eukprot:612202-Pelagomonas_calceolata.AAC.1